MRHVCAVILLLLAAPLVRADAGLPSFGPRPRPYIADQIAIFDGLDKYPGYLFFLAPAGTKVVAGAPVHTEPGARLVAVPKALASGADAWSPEWNSASAPGVLRSPAVQETQRRVTAVRAPTITTRFQVELTGDELKCTAGKEEVVVPPDNSPSAWAVIGGICGGLVLTVAIAVVGLVWIVRRLSRGPRTKTA